ncbi:MULTISPECIES: MBL fold metallo-hydrolase [unclassified Bradyrhizobium]|uniref:MBL fold metallo-hydrolase n=1 Tax=unclassified Bradyrhizobium TaxID=2631580 RepID=UPI002479C815|nr:MULTISPECIES: MBL fold metallo-hydrolase [unclassified Bradyrhizobium]WGR74916.1 MBL fold metallo-hydrolase [Bradyrhizobium sp. ISRA426]WGR79752.1 MBL fold metallo-hydrolase [Bradyrhizobium sp. ISRA430]WGR90088.1 MBL fold metallo-hydrolase [Bradyrhizobium sp. ISRA432]
MTDLNRRHLLAGAAAVGAAAVTGLGPTVANGAVPQSGAQAPGFYRYKIGSFECTSINDGARSFPMPDKFVVNVPKEEALAAADAAYMPKGMVTIPFNPQLINTGSKLVLIDSGNGVANFEASKGAVGRTLQNLAAAGVDPKSIDIVLLSHLHPDHTNGIRLADGSLAFPNAEIMVPAKDWEFWASEENAGKASSDMMKNYFANVKKTFAGLESKVTKYEWGKEVAPGITSIATPGHTPGHTSFAVASGNAKVLIQSDVTNIPELFLRNPDWHVAFDTDAALAQETRHKFYDMAAAEKATVVGFHFTFPSVGHVEKDGAKYRLIPSAWNPTI